MSEAYKCDRCGDLHEGHPERIVFKEQASGPDVHHVHEGQMGDEICPECSKDYDEFIDGRGLQQEPIGVVGEDRYEGSEIGTELKDYSGKMTVQVRRPSFLLNALRKGENVEELDDYMDQPNVRNY